MSCCSLWPEETHPAKRRRTRHQHFWRNSDKFDRDDRMYVPSKDVKPALQQKLLVQPKQDITQFERTNLWTVCLTTSGVVNYLNRKISPLGDSPDCPHPCLPLQALLQKLLSRSQQMCIL